MTEQNPVTVTYPSGRVPNVPSGPPTAPAAPVEHIVDGHLPPGSGAAPPPATPALGTALSIARLLLSEGHLGSSTLDDFLTVIDKIVTLL